MKDGDRAKAKDQTLEELKAQRKSLHDKSQKASNFDIDSLLNEHDKKIVTDKEYKKEREVIFKELDDRQNNMSLGERDSSGHRIGSNYGREAKHRREVAVPYYQRVNEVDKKIEKLGLRENVAQISSYYSINEDNKSVDDLNKKILQKLESNLEIATKNKDLRKSTEDEIIKIQQQIKDSEVDKKKNAAIFYGKTKKELALEVTIDQLKADLIKKQEALEKLPSAEENHKDLEKAAKALEEERSSQQALHKEREGRPKTEDPRVLAEQLAKEIKEIGKKSPEEKEALVKKVKSMAPQVLVTKFGEPPKSLLSVAEETKQGAIGVALLERANFPKEDMQTVLSSFRARGDRVQALEKENKKLSETDVVKNSLRERFESQASIASHSAPPLPNNKQQESSQVR
ncbi:MAG: hypothetical protein WBJ81_04150 [Rickettsiales bacterium]